MKPRTTDISRRGFLRLLGVATTAVAVGPTSALILDEKRYRNRQLGFEFAKPSNWHYLSYQEYWEQSDDQAAANESLGTLLRDQGDSVVAVVMYYKTPPEFTPNIVVYGEVPDSPWAPEEVLDVDFAQIEPSFPDFELEESRVSNPFGETPGCRNTFSYRVDLPSGASVRVRTCCRSATSTPKPADNSHSAVFATRAGGSSRVSKRSACKRVTLSRLSALCSASPIL